MSIKDRSKQAREGDRPKSAWRDRIHEVIFGTDTFAGKAFDVALLWAIILSVLAVMLESVHEVKVRYGNLLRITEWIFTILFSIEYIARIIAVRHPSRYIFSFYGIVDILAVIPTYLSLFLSGTHYLIIIRTLRLLRIFRIFKLGRYIGEAEVLKRALKASRHKITVFFGTVLSIVMITGTVMYLVEGPEHGYTSIPISIYWSIVTLTTVGYGDIAPQTVIGQFFASFIMIMGYAIIAVPTGIVTAEIATENKRKFKISTCTACGKKGHDRDANYCKRCGAQLHDTVA